MASIETIRTLDVILTAGCNLTCTYCYQNTKQPRRMEWETLRPTIDLLLRSERPEAKLQFLGGEPLMQFPLIRQAVDYVRTAPRRAGSVRFAIITNGTLMDEEKAAFLAAHRFKTQLSFDGVPAAQDLRGRGTFKVLDGLLDRLRARHALYFRDDLSVAFTLTSGTIPHLADSVEYFLGKGLQEIAVSPVFTHDAGWRTELRDELDRQFARIYKASLRHRRRTGEVPVEIFRKERGYSPHFPQGRTMCGVGQGETLTVDVDGQVHGCMTFATSMQKLPSEFLRTRLDAMKMGDVRDPAFAGRLGAYPEAARRAEIFNHKELKHSSYGVCRDCRYFDECGVCPASIGHIPGNTDPHRVPDFLCAFNLVALEYRRRFPHRPGRAEYLAGRAPVTGLMRDLAAFTAALRSTRPSTPA